MASPEPGEVATPLKTSEHAGATVLPLRLTARDLRRLREAHLAAQQADLQAQQTHHRLAALTLELEWRYGLLGVDATIDVHTGAITRPRATSAREETTP